MIDGILLLDKPAGPSSNRVLSHVRRWAGTRKVGHTGTLDPLASGLLPAVIGRATRLAPYLTLEPKRYEAAVRFGATTDTGDAQGTVTSECDPGAAVPADWKDLIARHIGVLQLPVPLFAAVKVGGRPLYRYARAKHQVELPVRSMHVFKLDSDTAEWPRVRLSVVCGTGTYIRSLALALGRACGCGAYVEALRRTAVGPWDVCNALSPDALPPLEQLSRAWIPLESALTLKTLRLPDDQVRHVRVGRHPETLDEQAGICLDAGERFVFTDTHGNMLAVARSREAWSASVVPPPFDFERVMVASE